jgi:uncharacterized membrane protein
MSELRKSFVWALLITLPMVLLAASASMWFAHSAGWFGFLLFAPMVGAMLLGQPDALLADAPDFVILGLGVTFQFLACFLLVLVIRIALKTKQQDES